MRRAGRAVQADRVHGPVVQTAREFFGGGAVAQAPVVFDTDVSDYGQFVAGGFAGGQDRFAQFVDFRECLENQQIDAGFDEHFDLLAKDGARLRKAGGAEWFQPDAQRSHGPRHKGLVACRLPRDTHAGLVDRAKFIRIAERRQTLAVSAEGVGFQNFRARFDVVPMNFPNQRRHATNSIRRSSD